MFVGSLLQQAHLAAAHQVEEAHAAGKVAFVYVPNQATPKGSKLQHLAASQLHYYHSLKSTTATTMLGQVQSLTLSICVYIQHKNTDMSLNLLYSSRYAACCLCLENSPSSSSSQPPAGVFVAPAVGDGPVCDIWNLETLSDNTQIAWDACMANKNYKEPNSIAQEIYDELDATVDGEVIFVLLPLPE